MDEDVLRVELSDGRRLSLPISQFDFLRDATSDQRASGIVDDNGSVLWWEGLLEGISVAGLIGVSETELEEFAGFHRR
ncbi:MAG: DUF2442 domain-containing protein [Candidatus Limnocylindria bacterium]